MSSGGPMTTRALGSEELALGIARRAKESVPAYARFLAQRGIRELPSLASAPLLDKQTYLGSAPYRDLLAEDYDRTFTIFKSSGSSGQSFYWPQLKDAAGAAVSLMRQFLESSFRIHERRTLAVVGLALGSWIGGEHMSWALKSLAQTTPYPFSVFSPGSVHDEIIAMIKNAEPFVDQFLIFMCPSAISHLHLQAQERGVDLPHAKLRYMVLGEPFPESLRIGLRRKAGNPPTDPVILSMYGSADTGFLGVESPATALLRQAMAATPGLAERFGVSRGLPHFFHFAAPDVYLEVVEGELCVTRWQGIPLIRYNLHDAATLYRWNAVVSGACAEGDRHPGSEALAAGLRSSPALPDVIAIAGRSDGCLILCGTNIGETMLDQAVRSDTLSAWLTGIYKARVVYDDDRQHLEFDLEWRQEAAIDRSAIDQVYARLVQELGRVQPEFLDDWKNVYRVWDQDPHKRILRLNPVRWPTLSTQLERAPKHRGIRP